MEEERIITTDNLKTLMPFSGGAVACEDVAETGLVYHLNIRLPQGGYVMLTVGETVAEKYPEYFKILKQKK